MRFVRGLLALCQGELDELSVRLPLRVQFIYQKLVARLRGRGVRAIHDRDSGLLALEDRDGTRFVSLTLEGRATTAPVFKCGWSGLRAPTASAPRRLGLVM